MCLFAFFSRPDICINDSESEAPRTPACMCIFVCLCVYFGISVVWPLSLWQAWSAEITARLPSPDSCCWVALNARFCNYKSVIIFPAFSFSPGAKLSVKHRHSAVLQQHLHTRPHGRPPTHKQMPPHTRARTHAFTHTHLDNQPRWFVLLTLMLIETPCSRVWQRLATVVMMDQQSKNDVKKGFVMHQRGRACVEAADIQNPTWHWRWAATTMNDPPLLRAAQRDCNAVIPNTISHQWQEKRPVFASN